MLRHEPHAKGLHEQSGVPCSRVGAGHMAVSSLTTLPTWVGVGHVWQARLMSWLIINMSMLMNAQMIYNYRSITKS